MERKENPSKWMGRLALVVGLILVSLGIIYFKKIIIAEPDLRKSGFILYSLRSLISALGMLPIILWRIKVLAANEGKPFADVFNSQMFKKVIIPFRKGKQFSLPAWLAMLIYGGFYMGIALGILFVAMTMISPSYASAVFAGFPFIAFLILGSGWAKQYPKLFEERKIHNWAGAGLIFTGTLVVSGVGFILGGSTLGWVLAFISMVLMGLSITLTKIIRPQTDTILLTAIIYIGATVFLLPLALVMTPQAILAVIWQWNIMAMLTFSAVATVVAMLFYLWGFRLLKAAEASLWWSPLPVYVSIFSAMFGLEPFSLTVLISSALIVLGLWVSQGKVKTAEAKGEIPALKYLLSGTRLAKHQPLIEQIVFWTINILLISIMGPVAATALTWGLFILAHYIHTLLGFKKMPQAPPFKGILFIALINAIPLSLIPIHLWLILGAAFLVITVIHYKLKVSQKKTTFFKNLLSGAQERMKGLVSASGLGSINGVAGQDRSLVAKKLKAQKKKASLKSEVAGSIEHTYFAKNDEKAKPVKVAKR